MSTEFNDLYFNKTEYYGDKASPSLVRYLEMYDIPKEGYALDIGCGQGRNSLYLAQQGFSVTGIDNSAEAISCLTAVANKQNLQVTTGLADIEKFVINKNHYQLIVANTLLDHLPVEQSDVIAQNIIDGLAPGGFLFVSVFTINDPGYNAQGRTVSETATHVKHYYQSDELLKQFADLTLLSYQEEYWLDEGHGEPHYHGMARMFAQKPFEQVGQ
jgi:2-polyprenyl-3-methyl-5-hydroxy-6-metoxy-1,4-benzoquinol methylase